MIVGIDRFMSEARALTNFTGNAVATVLIGTWVKEIDGEQVDRVLSGDEPFDELTMIAGHGIGLRDAAASDQQAGSGQRLTRRMAGADAEPNQPTRRRNRPDADTASGRFRAGRATFDFYQKVKAQMTAAVKVRGIPCRAL